MASFTDTFSRPDPELVAALGAIPSANLGDAMGRQGVMHSRISPICKGVGVVGPAYTVSNYAKDNLMSHYAIKQAKAGDVLVISTGGHMESAGWGELMTQSAMVKGLAGVIIDGGVRDLDDLVKLKFPVYAACITPQGTVKATPGSVNQPIVCGDITVSPGDIIVGDSDGVAVVPVNEASHILAQAQQVIEKEAGLREKVLKGETIYDMFELHKLLPSQEKT
jgi:4-hydroxy-4-methyl-2-oxoglutarate aldolase